MFRRQVVKSAFTTVISAGTLFTTPPAIAQQRSRATIMENLKVKGTYRWVLHQVIDNPTNSDSNLSVSVKKVEKVSVVDFVKSVASEKKYYSFSGKVSFGVKTKEFSGSAEASYSTHREVFSSLERSTTTTTSKETTTEISQNFVLPPGYQGAVYRLTYEMGGALVETDILSLTRRDDLEVTATVDIESRIPGFTVLANRLSSIVPKSDNRGEWSEIRLSIVRNSAKSNPEQFEVLLDTLANITPKSDNRGEWRTIREGSIQIRQSLEDGNYFPFFISFVRLLSGIVPKSDNRGEWSAIRTTCSEILSQIEEL